MGSQAVTGNAASSLGDPVSPRPKVTIRPMHLTLWDEASITNVRKPIGYRAECSCGWKGRIHRKRPDAGMDRQWHRDSHK